MIAITSRQNTLCAHVRKLLRSSSYRKEQGLFVAEGPHAVGMLLDRDEWSGRVEGVLVSASYAEAHPDHARAADWTVAADEVFDSVSDTRQAQGLLAVVRMPEDADEAHAINDALVLLLDGISDPGNLGTLIRSAAAAGVRRVFLHGDTVDPYNPKVLRSTAGMFTQAAVIAVTERDVRAMLDAGARLVRAESGAAPSVYDYVPSGTVLLAVGHEAHGFSPCIGRLPGDTVSIPMAEGCESLNAAVAGSICLFEMARKM